MVNRPIKTEPVDNSWLAGCGLLPGAACVFEAADGFLVAADFGGDGLEAAAHVVELDGEAGQGGGVVSAGAVFLDDGAQVGPPVEGGAAEVRARGDVGERDGLSRCGEVGAGCFDEDDDVAGVSWHWPGLSDGRGGWFSSSAVTPREGASQGRAAAIGRECAISRSGPPRDG